MKKRITVLVCALAMTLLCSCGPRSTEEEEVRADTPYEEWVNEVGINGTEDLKLRRFNEDAEKTIESFYVCKDDAGFAELSDMVTGHNQFIKNNPDYFKEGTSVVLIRDAGMHGVNTTNFCFFNDLRDFHVIMDSTKATRKDYGEDLGRVNDGTLQYMYVDLRRCLDAKLFDRDVTYRIPVAIVDLDKIYYGALTESVSFLTKLEGLEQVVISDFEEGTEQEIFESIMQVVPDVEVYFDIYKD